MKAKQYSNVFDQAKQHPKGGVFLQEAHARIRLAEALNRERMSQSISMAELAKRASTTPAVVSRIENAQVSAGIDIIARLFEALGKKNVTISFA